MNKFLSSIIFVLILSTCFTQEHDVRLLEKYDQVELDKMKSNNQELYQFLNVALDKAIFIGEIPQEKGKDIEFDGELEVDLKKEHTFLSLGIVLKENEYQYFKIKGSNKMVGVLPKSLIK